MASLISPPVDTLKFSSPKRARLSLKHHFVRPPARSKYDSIQTKEENMIIDVPVEQDENISPNCDISETRLSPYISDNVINNDYKVSVLGLPNCGNTCFINSIVQVLRYTPKFPTTLHDLVASQNQLAQISSNPSEVKPDDFFHKLHMVYVTMKKQEEFLHKNLEEDYISVLLNHVESFVTSLGEISSLFKEGEQHDAHEFLLTVKSHFDIASAKVKEAAKAYCNNAKELIKVTPPSPKDKKKLNKRDKYRLLSAVIESGLIKKISNFGLGFEGNILHTVKCLECENRSERFESFTNLEVSIAQDFVCEGIVDLCQCIFQRTVLGGDNKYFCEECFHSTEAHIFSEIISLPPILVLHCSTLIQSSYHSQIEKDSTKIAIPLFIKASENINIFLNATDDIYCLYAIVFHIGTSTENGHYVSFIKETSQNSTTLDYSLLKNKQNSDDISCCGKPNIFHPNLNSSANNWLFFDDEEVIPLNINNSSVFPYYEFMTTSASPCIIFYYKK